MTAIELIAQERERQILEEGWTDDNDDQQEVGELAAAAACYAMPPHHRYTEQAAHSIPPKMWPWEEDRWKPTLDDRVRELIKAGALIVAEIERLQRAPARLTNCPWCGNWHEFANGCDEMCAKCIEKIVRGMQEK